LGLIFTSNYIRHHLSGVKYSQGIRSDPRVRGKPYRGQIYISNDNRQYNSDRLAVRMPSGKFSMD
jgi:hypothetical protein